MPSELQHELDQMHTAGIGGVEIQPVYPELPNDPARHLINLPYLSPGFLTDLQFANHYARSLGMRVDITLGSGWPYGGPQTTLANSAGCLRLIERSLSPNAETISAVPLAPGDTILAAFLADGAPGSWDVGSAARIALPQDGQPISITPASHPRTALFFLASHTHQQVKRAAVGAEGPVLDHFSRSALDQHLRGVAVPLLAAFGAEPPFSVFSDSLEVYGSDWTTQLPAEFQRRRGYDLLPHLPELVRGTSAEAAAIRRDWGLTLAELVRDNYLAPLNQFAAQHHTRLRSQTYGEPAVRLVDEGAAALPEGEGPQWRAFSFTRWATSAAHLDHRNVVTSETWTWLHSPAFRATPLDMKVEADRMFLQGVNGLVGHGWPYSPPAAGEPGFSLYAAAALNAHNPWWPVMPDIMAYLTRASWLLRQGEPANDVALLLPEDDAEAEFTLGHVAVTDGMKQHITPALTSAILDAGYNLDYIDAATINRLGLHHPLLVIPPTQRIPLSTYRAIAAYARRGGRVVALGHLPSLAPGFLDKRNTAAILNLSRILFGPEHPPSTRALNTVADLPAALHSLLPPDLKTSVPAPELGFLHRHLPSADLYFLVNSSNQPRSLSVQLRAHRATTERWDLQTGTISRMIPAANGALHLNLAPYESVTLVEAQMPSPELTAAPPSGAFTRTLLDLSDGWQIAFGSGPPESLGHLVSWTDLPGHSAFSGEAVYTRRFTLANTPQQPLWLDLGVGTPTVDARPPDALGIHALLAAPVREAAIIVLNGHRAAAVWHPPYRVDLTAFAHAGVNDLQIHVGNTAINAMAAEPAVRATEPPRGYAAADVIYGVRATPQDMQHLQPVPSGLLGPIRLLTPTTSPAEPR